MSEAAESSRAPAVVVEAFDEYVKGLPMTVAITFVNRTDDTGMGAIPRLNLWRADGPIEFEWTDARKRVQIIKAPGSMQEEPRGATLGPGESLRTLYDLSLLAHQPAPGAYSLRVKLRYYDSVSVSAPVKVRITTASAAEGPAHKLLAALGEHTWAAFVRDNPHTVVVPRLPERAARLLALHLFLQRAANGHEGPASLDPRLLAPVRHGPAEATAELYHLELLQARKSPDATALGHKLTERWPGLRADIADIEADQGPIATLREALGSATQ